MLDKPASVPAGFTLDGYLRRGEFSYLVEQGRPIRLRALFDRDTALHLVETPLSDDQRWTERRDGRVMIEARVHNTMELRWWLLGFGNLVEVRGPKRLREEMADKVRRMARMYAARRGRRGRAVAGP